MASWTLKTLWIDGEPVEFGDGSTLNHDRQTLTVQSCGKLPCGECTSVTLKVEVSNGTTYEGYAKAGIPKVVVNSLPALYIFAFTAEPPLVPSR
jgi:hypothetical protein